MRHILPACVMFGTLAALASGCAVLSPGAGHSGGGATLSEAMDAANADSSKKVKRMEVGEETPPGVAAEVDVATSLAPEESQGVAAPKKKSEQHLHFGVVYGAGLLGGTQYDRLEAFGLSGGAFEAGRTRWDILVLMTDTYFKGESRQGHAFQDAVDFELDVTRRWYLTRDQTSWALTD